MNPEFNHPEDGRTAGARMTGANNFDMVSWEKNRQMYNPEPAAEKKPAAPEQEDIREIYKRQKSMLHRLKRAVGME